MNDSLVADMREWRERAERAEAESEGRGRALAEAREALIKRRDDVERLEARVEQMEAARDTWMLLCRTAEDERDTLSDNFKLMAKENEELRADRDAALDLLRRYADAGATIGEENAAPARALLARVDSGTSRSAVGNMGLSGNLKVYPSVDSGTEPK